MLICTTLLRIQARLSILLICREIRRTVIALVIDCRFVRQVGQGRPARPPIQKPTRGRRVTPPRRITVVGYGGITAGRLSVAVSQKNGEGPSV